MIDINNSQGSHQKKEKEKKEDYKGNRIMNKSRFDGFAGAAIMAIRLIMHRSWVIKGCFIVIQTNKLMFVVCPSHDDRDEHAKAPIFIIS